MSKSALSGAELYPRKYTRLKSLKPKDRRVYKDLRIPMSSLDYRELRNKGERTFMECVFCNIVSGKAPSKQVYNWPGAIAIVPLNPVTQGHLLVIPKIHVSDYIDDPKITAYTVQCAAEIGTRSSNLITSAGSAASQTVFHLHVHVVPRKPGDGLLLPWSNPNAI